MFERLLLDNEADPNRIVGRWNPLHLASYDDNSDTIQLLLKYGADLGCMGEEGQIPLHLASGAKVREGASNNGWTLNQIRSSYRRVNFELRDSPIYTGITTCFPKSFKNLHLPIPFVLRPPPSSQPVKSAFKSG